MQLLCLLSKDPKMSLLPKYSPMGGNSQQTKRVQSPANGLILETPIKHESLRHRLISLFLSFSCTTRQKAGSLIVHTISYHSIDSTSKETKSTSFIHSLFVSDLRKLFNLILIWIWMLTHCDNEMKISFDFQQTFEDLGQNRIEDWEMS